jgi:exodeoxyribonuclease V alpha subunit
MYGSLSQPPDGNSRDAETAICWRATRARPARRPVLPRMTDALDVLRARGVLADIDWHFARALGRMADEQRGTVLLAAALASRAVREGHVCVDLPRLIGGAALVDDAGVAVDCVWPGWSEWTAALDTSALITAGETPAAAPLVLDASGRLYLQRYWRYQTRLAAALLSRAAEEEPAIDDPVLAAGLARLFSAEQRESGAVDDQCVAAVVAVLRRLCVISGGPGTGKTHTVVRILALLVEQALQRGERPPRVALLAPTGKAAARLSEAIRIGKAELPCGPEVVAAIPQEAATLHRGLGAIPGRSARYRHGPDQPLLADVVVVDEASMVDLALMARLLDAVPAHARLILLGDRDQLASVEAGAVLGDICNRGAGGAFSDAFAARVAARLGVMLPRGAAAPTRSGIWDCIVSLTRSYRYRVESGIGRLAAAINAGDVDGVGAALAAGGGVMRIDPAPAGALGPQLERAVRDGFAPYCAAADALQRLEALQRFRVLCAHRRGPFGVEQLNAQIEQLLAAAGQLRTDAVFYLGRPILVTENDYQVQLFNGDVGTIAAHPQRPNERVAVFLAPDGSPRYVAPARLPPHETAFAMSVHKSQGSEFDAVAVLLPDEPSPITSRELLYTAVTRARERVVLSARPAVIAHAVTHRSERASGLRDALWERSPARESP